MHVTDHRLQQMHTLPHAHGDHFHLGPALVSVRDATGLGNPNVVNALARKGLLLAEPTGLPVLTTEGLAYDTGIAAEILARRRSLERCSNLSWREERKRSGGKPQA
jgi:hypothetical protein